MVDDDTFNALSKLLWPNGNSTVGMQVYWLLDGARDAAILPKLKSGGLEYTCLFQGALHPQLEASAPYLVHLSHDSITTSRLLRAGWGNAWGILILAAPNVTLTQQRIHFKKFLRVQTENGLELGFRFYDPRALDAYAPSCWLNEFQFFLGPLGSICFESLDGKIVNIFEKIKDGIVSRKYCLKRQTSSATSQIPQNEAESGSLNKQKTRRFVLRDPQIKALSLVPYRDFVLRLSIFIRAKYPALDLGNDEELGSLISDSITQARNIGFDAESGIARFLDYRIRFGEEFDTDTRLPFNQIFHNGRLNSTEKFDLLDSLLGTEMQMRNRS